MERKCDIVLTVVITAEWYEPAENEEIQEKRDSFIAWLREALGIGHVVELQNIVNQIGEQAGDYPHTL